MSVARERLVEVDVLEAIRLTVVQLGAILEAIGAQVPTNRVVGDALGGAVYMAERIAERMEKLTD